MAANQYYIMSLDYKFKTNKQVAAALFISGKEYVEPFFNSYNKSKKTFFLQVINLVLVFTFFKVLLDGFLDYLLDDIRGVTVLSAKIVLLVLVALITSAFRENNIIRWQLLFETGYELTKKWLVIFVLITFGGIYLRKNTK